MNATEVIAHVKALNLPEGAYVVFGSCPMAIAGLRDANDIDLFVTPQVLEQLENDGWTRIEKGENDAPYVSGIFEAHSHWNFSPYAPTLHHLLEGASIIDGVAVASLDEVRKWKDASGRPKDHADIALIDAHLAKM